jgi:hypothetical protein
MASKNFSKNFDLTGSFDKPEVAGQQGQQRPDHHGGHKLRHWSSQSSREHTLVRAQYTETRSQTQSGGNEWFESKRFVGE